ncbi:MAG: sugar kinase [Bdellovibrionales bacterium]|nr:sugar kinase [Bdellovibrionales bacterium]
MSEILVVGSVAYDSISTPQGKAEHILGGSANYFSVASSLYAKVNVVGVVGDDYAEKDFELLRSRNVSLEGLQQVSGKTFHWQGKYEDDMNEAITLETQLNVFEHFDPTLPESYKDSKYVFLANIDPELQLKVLEQVRSPKFVGLDTMNLWIDIKKDKLKEVMGKVDVVLINEGEARMFAGTMNTVKAIKEIASHGPRGVVVKRGEYGFMMYSEGQFFVLPAFPVDNVVDPTGAGDTFAGGFFGYLAKTNTEVNMESLKNACIHGCLIASYTVEGFGLSKIEKLDWSMVEGRHNKYRSVISYNQL